MAKKYKKQVDIYLGQSRSSGIKGKWIALLRKPSGTAKAVITPQKTKKQALKEIRKIKQYPNKNIKKLR